MSTPELVLEFEVGIIMKKVFLVLFLSALLIGTFSNKSVAQTTFTTTQSGDWDKGATWGNAGNTQGVDWPAGTDNAIITIGTTILLIGNETINDFTIDGGGVLDDNNKVITINGNFVLNGTKTGTKNTEFTGGAGTSIGGTGVHSSTKNLAINGNTLILAGTNLTVINNIELAAGIIVTNSGLIVINNDLKGADVLSTWINSTNSTLTVSKNLLVTGTLTADATGNTVVYNRNNIQDIKLPSGSPSTYFNLTVEGTGIKTLLGDITISGTLAINTSTLETDAVNNYNISIGGDFTNFGTFNENLSTVTFEGLGPQTITNTSGETFYNLTFNKSSGTVTLANNVIISNILNISSGVINSGSNKLTLGTGTGNMGTLTFGAGQIIGQFERWIANTEAGVDFDFPVGTQASQRLAKINFTGINTGGSILFQFVENDPGNAGLSLVDGTVTIYNTFVDGYWDMQIANGFSLGANTFDLDLDGTSFLGFPIDMDTRLLTRATAGSNWVAEGTHVDAADPTAFRTGLSTMGAQYAFGDDTNCTGPVTSAITGSTDVCSSDTNIFYSVTDNGNTYTWTITGGTQVSGGSTADITVDWGAVGQVGNVSVLEFNGCTYGVEENLSVDINSIPPASIVGKTSVPENATNEPYSVTSRSGYSYTWNITGGTQASGGTAASITVDWGSSGTGNVSVVAQKSGCTSAAPVDIDVLKYIVIKSQQSGNWGTASSWNTGTVPLSSENVRILGGHTITITGNETINNLTVDFGGTLDAVTNNKVLSVDGDITMNGNYLGGSKALELNGINTVIDGAGTISITGQNININDGNKTILSSANLNISAGNFNLKDANITLTNNGSLTIAEDLIGNADGSTTWINSANSTLKIGGMVFSAGGTLNASASGNTVEYNGTIAQDIYNASDFTYHHLTISGSNSKTLLNNTIINGDINILSGTLDVGTNNNINLAGNWIASGGGFTPASGLVIFDGSQDQDITSGGNVFNVIDIAGTGTKSILDNLAVTGDLTISSTLDVTSSNYLIDLGGDFVNNGVFAPQLGEITLTGTIDQEFRGSSVSDVHNLTFNKGTGDVYIENTVRYDGSVNFSQATAVYANGIGGIGRFELVSNSTRTGRIAVVPVGSQLIGTFYHNRHLPNTSGNRAWRYLSSPVSGMTVEKLKSKIPVTGTFVDPSTQAEWPGIPGIVENSPSMYEYDETAVTTDQNEGWKSYPPDGVLSVNAPLNSGQGYAVYVRSTSDEIIEHSGNGVIFDVPVNVTASGLTGPGDPNGWNLVGNPYPSSIDWDNVTLPAGVNNEIHFLDNTNNIGTGAGSYIRYVGGVGTPGSYAGEIAMGQAFWIRATSNATITFQEDDKITNDAQFIRMVEPSDLLRISLEGNGKRDETVIRFWPEATNEFDSEFDAHQLNLARLSISSLLPDASLISINSLNDDFCSREIKLSVMRVESGAYELNFFNLESFRGGMDIQLLDSYTDEIINVFEFPLYSFDVSIDTTSYGNDRFSLFFQKKLDEAVDSDHEPEVCENSLGLVWLNYPQSNVKYLLTKDGMAVSDTLVAYNERLNLNYDLSLLDFGENIIKLNAYHISCDIWAEIKDIVVVKNSVPEPPVSIDGEGCQGDVVELSVQSFGSGSTYLWFETKESEEPIPGEINHVFLTQPLDSSRSYWISEVTESGCESSRVEVRAEVLTISKPVITADGFTLRASEAEGYQWYLNGEIIEEATGQYFESFYSGEYTVEVSVGNCTELSEPYTQLVSDIESTKDNGFIIYPNPVEDQIEIQIDYNLLNSTDIYAKVFQMDGRLIMKFKIGNGYRRSVNVSSLLPGLYVIKLHLPDRVIQQKFLKE